MYFKQLSFGLTAVALLATTSIAQAGAMDEKFAKTDVNQDGYITYDEAEGHPEIVDNWKSLDLDQDGKLSAVEHGTLQPPGAGIVIERR
ncbi:MAG: EF-hand domain-containing protein [Gammaproteobacteria bacterium]|nr:EF-hand domain-containing protein [Gammaproteobacteria bacterium]